MEILDVENFTTVQCHDLNYIYHVEPRLNELEKQEYGQKAIETFWYHYSNSTVNIREIFDIVESYMHDYEKSEVVNGRS